MEICKLLNELDRIIDVGIVNAHHDTEILKEVREKMKDMFSDMSDIRSCKVCAYVDRAQCDPDAPALSGPHEMWRGCMHGPQDKVNWRWRLEEAE